MSDVINDTKLAKNTIRLLYYNEAKGIQYETLETLCNYLAVDIGRFLEIVSFNIEIKEILHSKNNLYIVRLNIKRNSELINEELLVTAPKTQDPVFSFKISRKLLNMLLTFPERKREELTKKI